MRKQKLINVLTHIEICEIKIKMQDKNVALYFEAYVKLMRK